MSALRVPLRARAEHARIATTVRIVRKMGGVAQSVENPKQQRMSMFYKQVVFAKDLPTADKSCDFATLVELIKGSPFHDRLLQLFQVNPNSKERINIPGVKTLVNNIVREDSNVIKFDLDLHLSQVTLNHFSEEDEAVLDIRLTKEQKKEVGVSHIEARTIYSARPDYFEGAYNLDKFARFCSRERHVDILQENLNRLNTHYKDSSAYKKRFRFLKDKENVHYVRAITSRTHYRDYNIRVSLFIAVISLHRLMTTKGWQFAVNWFHFDESNINVLFEKIGGKRIEGLGNTKFLVELSNNEIKKGALKFSRAIVVTVPDKRDKLDLHFQPTEDKNDLISIRHNYEPATAFDKLSRLSERIKEAEEDVYGDLEEISKIKFPDEIRHLLETLIDRSTSSFIQEFKPDLRQILDTQVASLGGLLKLMHKLNLVVSENLEATEYLRYNTYRLLKQRISMKS